MKKERKKQTNKQRIIKREREKKKFKIERDDDVAINQRQKQSDSWQFVALRQVSVAWILSTATTNEKINSK